MSCSPTPTETQYTTIVTTSLSTSFTTSLTTLAGSVTTISSESCLATATGRNASGCISSTEVSAVSSVPGVESTVQVPIVITVSVTQSEATNTLFATCSSSGSSSPPDSSTTPTPTQTPSLPASSTSSSTSSTPSSSSSQSLINSSYLTYSTPPPTTFTIQSSTTLPDGSVSYTVVTETSTGPATPIYLPTSISAPAQGQIQSGGGGSNNNREIAPIVGGVVGGVVGLALIIGLIWLLWRRKKYWNDIFEEGDEDEAVAHPVRPRKGRNVDLASEPKPYQYGLVGSTTPPTSASLSDYPGNAPNSPPSRTSSYNALGRNLSLAPLTLPGPGLTPGPSQPQTASSRPSTGGSIQPLMQTGTPQHQPQGQRWPSAAPEENTGNQRLSTWNPNTDGLGLGSDLGHEIASAVSGATAVESRRPLQIANPNPMSPTSTIASAGAGAVPGAGEKSGRRPRRESANVVVHRDGGRAPQGNGSGSGLGQGNTSGDAPPAYS